MANNTDLKGAVIASSQAALDQGKNTFTTGGTLTTSDIQNSASYSAQSWSVSVSGAPQAPKPGLHAPGIGIGSDKAGSASTTTAGISGMAGNKAVRSTDAQTGLAKIFDADKVQKEVNAQVQITQYFGQQASKAVGDYAKAKLNEAKDLTAQAGNTTDTARRDALLAQAEGLADNWGDKGALRVLAHTLIGGLTGGAGGAAGAAAGTLTAPLVADALRSAGIEGPLASTLTALASTAAGALAGGAAGAAAGFNEVANNYLNHEDASRLLALQKKLNNGTLTTNEAQERSDLVQKDTTTNRQQLACTGSTTAACQTVNNDFEQAKQSFLPSQNDIQKWANDKAAGSPYTAGQLIDAYNFAFTKGAQPKSQTSTGDLSSAYDWIVNDLSAAAKANGGADVTDKIYMGWATANAPSVAGGITSAILANQALSKAGWQVGAALGVKGGTATASGIANTVSGARLNMQLTAEQAAGTRAPTTITSYSDHAVKQIGSRDGGIGVSQAAVNDAFANPVSIQYVPSKYGPTFKYTGQNATVVVNSEGNAVTTWATNSAGTGK